MKLLLAGISGYGSYYMKLLTEYVDLEKNPLCGVVDPYPEKSPWLSWLKEHGVPVYPSLKAFYEKNTADLVFLATPIALHKPQILEAMEHGSHVLCEKPLTARIQDAFRAERSQGPFWKITGSRLPVVLLRYHAKAETRYTGRCVRPPPFFFHLHILEKDDSYYDPRGWKGKVYDPEKGWYLDSVATNATAHYLHGLLFLLGDTMDTAAMARICGGQRL